MTDPGQGAGRADRAARREAARRPRPRDALGRPLPHGAQGVPPLPDADSALPPDAALRRAQQLLDSGLLFQAHEVLEGVWKAAPLEERELWRGLTQLVVGLTHAARGNRTGACILLERGARRLKPYASRTGAASAASAPRASARPTPHRIDLAGLLRWAETLAADLRTSGPADLTPPRLTIP